MHTLQVLRLSNYIIVRSRIRCLVRIGNRNVLAELVFITVTRTRGWGTYGTSRQPEAGQLVNEFPEVRAVRIVRQCDVNRRVNSCRGRCHSSSLDSCPGFRRSPRYIRLLGFSLGLRQSFRETRVYRMPGFHRLLKTIPGILPLLLVTDFFGADLTGDPEKGNCYQYKPLKD